MKGYYFLIVFIGSVYYFSDAAIDLKLELPYCFQFTWPGPYDNQTKLQVNCSQPGIPCFKPVVVTNDGTPPDTNYMWKTQSHSTIGCPLRSGFVCLKYTYLFNNEIENITYFCGKMIQDTVTAVDYGCYITQTEGHTIEACACQSSSGKIPCNSSPRKESSTIISVASIIFLMLLHDVMNIGV